MTTRRYSKGKPKPRCHHCGRLGHIKRFCRDLRVKEGQKERKEKSGTSQKAATLVTQEDSDSEKSVLISISDHALSASSNEQCTWIIDSGATCHMCHDRKSFTTLYQLQEAINVMLGDRRMLTAVGKGKVALNMILPNGGSKLCTVHDVLYVPKLSYNLISVAKASQKGKIVKFTKSACYILDDKHKMVARVGSLSA